MLCRVRISPITPSSSHPSPLRRGPVRVYVLERRGAVRVWLNLMGDADPEVARKHQPDSLRALYGVSALQNAVMGSPDNETAEIQIASLFASSPPFPIADLPDSGSIRSADSSILRALQESASSEAGYPPSTTTNPSTVGGTKRSRPSFKARPLPSTHSKPDIVPRTTKAASLRAGVPVEQKPSGPRRPLSKEALAKTFANVPGHKRTDTIVVASTAPPVIAPRMTRAASLRLGQQPPPKQMKQVRSHTSDTAARTKPVTQGTFDGVPGHKRRDTISVASTKAPTVAPRTNRSAALRAMKDSTQPPSSCESVPAPLLDEWVLMVSSPPPESSGSHSYTFQHWYQRTTTSCVSCGNTLNVRSPCGKHEY